MTAPHSERGRAVVEKSEGSAIATQVSSGRSEVATGERDAPQAEREPPVSRGARELGTRGIGASVPLRIHDRLTLLQWLTVLVPAVCAGLYETVRHSLLATELPNALGTLIAVALVLAISFAFARVAFSMIRRTNSRLRERNRQLQALTHEVQRLAVIEERDRLAREMHDSVAQVLAYLMVRLDTIEGLLSRDRIAEASREVEQLRASADGAYADVREAIAGLRTRPGVGAAGLAEALSTYVTEYGERVPIEAAFHAEAPSFVLDVAPVPPPVAAAAAKAGSRPGADLSPSAELQLLRIAQESLANVRKHSHAQHVDVWFWGDAAGWHLVVRDDGRGFDPQTTGAGRQHFGLPIMRERAHSLGGGLAVTSAPGAGTTIRVSVPYARAAERPAHLEGGRHALADQGS